MKNVAMIIKVPSGSLCWSGSEEVCEHFDNCGGHPSCALGFHNEYDRETGEYRKSEGCKALPTVG